MAPQIESVSNAMSAIILGPSTLVLVAVVLELVMLEVEEEVRYPNAKRMLLQLQFSLFAHCSSHNNMFLSIISIPFQFFQVPPVAMAVVLVVNAGRRGGGGQGHGGPQVWRWCKHGAGACSGSDVQMCRGAE